jgi:brefeldin A-resistance guanine nucleotide exchange factor 1
MSGRDQEALRAAVACLEACHIGDVFADSKFLQAESLIRLCRAIIAAAGPVQRIAAVGEDTAGAEVRSRASRHF